MGIKRRFTEHPSSVDESYVEHMRVAFGFSGQLALASGKAAVHALLPWMCCTSASQKVSELNHRMTSGARQRTALSEQVPAAGSLAEPLSDVAV